MEEKIWRGGSDDDDAEGDDVVSNDVAQLVDHDLKNRYISSLVFAFQRLRNHGSVDTHEGPS